jgi:chromosome segregation ATPase
MADMTKLLQTINGNVVLNGERQEKILEAINKLAEFGVQITGKLDTIIKKLGNNTTKLDELIKLLQTMDANNETRNKKILAAIEKLNGNMTAGFTALIELGKEHNELQTETNNLIEVAIGLLEKMPGGAINLEELISAIKDNTEAIILEGNNANAWLQDIYALLTKLNDNVVKGDEENNKVLNKILAAINKLNPTDISAVLAKLDAILAAIKDHKVKVVIVNGEETVQCDPDVDEGVKEDLEWLLS